MRKHIVILTKSEMDYIIKNIGDKNPMGKQIIENLTDTLDKNDNESIFDPFQLEPIMRRTSNGKTSKICNYHGGKED